MSLAIVHREPGIEPIPTGAAVWRTCLREVAFVDDGDRVALGQVGQRLEEGDAYRLLLEILCGLQSPMLGETQVMGQFKAFLATLGRDQASLNRLGQRLLTDARDVRAKHLQGLGSRSYGSAIRRYLGGCEQAAVIGAGKLAQEVLPFLSDDGRGVDQWGRSNESGGQVAPRVTYRTLDSLDTCPQSSRPTMLIVAAPVTSEVVERVAERYASLTCVIDLRADLGGRAPVIAAPVVTLQALFDRMRESQTSAVPHIEAARTEIAWCSHRYQLRDELRPFGWDDLCA